MFQWKCKIRKVQILVVVIRVCDGFVNKEIPSENLFLALHWYMYIYISSTEYFLLYFLSKLIVIHSYTDTNRVEIYTI